MSLLVRPVTREEVLDFATWRYEPPYDVYDIAEDGADAIDYFLDPSVRCHVLVDDDRLVGFCTYGADARVPGGDYSTPALDIGLGIRPSLTGRGRGRRFVGAVCAHAASLDEAGPLRVTVAAWNDRARAVWSSAGFTERDRFTSDGSPMGSREWVILIRE